MVRAQNATSVGVCCLHGTTEDPYTYFFLFLWEGGTVIVQRTTNVKCPAFISLGVRRVPVRVSDPDQSSVAIQGVGLLPTPRR